jgi:hypothetical protein
MLTLTHEYVVYLKIKTLFVVGILNTLLVKIILNCIKQFVSCESDYSFPFYRFISKDGRNRFKL